MSATCQVVERWLTARGDFNARELHVDECGEPMVAIIPADRCLDGATDGPCSVCDMHWSPPTEEDLEELGLTNDEMKFCRLCGEYDNTAVGHGLGECIAEYTDDGPDV